VSQSSTFFRGNNFPFFFFVSFSWYKIGNKRVNKKPVERWTGQQEPCQQIVSARDTATRIQYNPYYTARRLGKRFDLIISVSFFMIKNSNLIFVSFFIDSIIRSKQRWRSSRRNAESADFPHCQVDVHIVWNTTHNVSIT